MLKYLTKENFETLYKQILSEDAIISSCLLSYLINHKLVLTAYFGEYYFTRDPEKTDPELYLHMDVANHPENIDILDLRFHFRSDNIFRYKPYGNGRKRPEYEFKRRQERRDNFRQGIEKSLYDKVKKRESKTFEEKLVKAESTAYLFRKYTEDASLRNDPTPSTCSINVTEIYQKAHQQLIGSIANDPKNPTLKFWRAYNFLAYNTITKKNFFDNYGEKDALDDLNRIIEINDKTHLVILLTALEVRAKKAIENKELLLAVRLLRQAQLLIYNNNKFTKIFDEKVFLPSIFKYNYNEIRELICNLRSKNTAMNPGELAIEYHAIMALNHTDYFPSWRSQIVALFKYIDIDNSKGFKVFVNFIKKDDMAFDYQKSSILKEFYAYAFEKAKLEKDKVKQKNIYDNLLSTASDYLIESTELAENDSIKAAECHDIAISIFNKIPLTHETAIEAQISLADHYYYTNLDEHNDQARAFVAANPYHQKALTALKKQGADTPEGDFQLQIRFTNYSQLIEEREKAAEEYEKTIPKKPNIFIQLLSMVKVWFTGGKYAEPTINVATESKNSLTADKKSDVVRPKSEASDKEIIPGIDSGKSKTIATQSATKKNAWCFSFAFPFNFFRTNSQKHEDKNNVLKEDATTAVAVAPKP